MDKKLWINLGLLAFILVLALALNLPQDEPEEELPRLSDINQDSIQHIHIQRKDLEDFIFTKQTDGWHMTAPMQYKANIARINAMLKMLKIESHGELNLSEVDLSQFDLDHPSIVMKLNDHEFLFGTTDAIDQRRYVLFNNQIHLTSDFLYQQLTTNAAFFADLKLIPDSFEINAIQYPENKMTKVDDVWKLDKLMDIKPEQLKQLAFNWKQASAISASRYVEQEKIFPISIFSNDETVEFVIVSTDPHLILGRPDLGIQYHMGSDEAEKLLLKENPSLEPELSDPD